MLTTLLLLLIVDFGMYGVIGKNDSLALYFLRAEKYVK